MDQTRHKNRSKRIILISALGLGLVVIGILALSPREPVYQGKTVSRWIKEFYDYPRLMGVMESYVGNGRTFYDFRAKQHRNLDDPPLKALRALGPQAMPYLIIPLKTRETRLGKTYTAIFQKTPLSFRRFMPAPSYAKRASATLTLLCMGEAAKSATPALIEMAHEESQSKEGRVLFQLTLSVLANLGATTNQIGPLLQDLSRDSRYSDVLSAIKTLQVKGPTAALALASVLESKDATLRQEALVSLQAMGSDAKPAVPALVKMLNTGDRQVQDAARQALLKIDREAAVAADLK